MVGSMKGINIAIVGGDKREIELYKYFSSVGASLKIIGFEKLALYFPRQLLTDIKEGVESADVIIFPLTGIDAHGKIYAPYAEKDIVLDEEAIFLLKQGSLLLSGYIPSQLKTKFNERGVCFKETAPLNEISIRNAVPTAEGAIQKAMENSELTIHGSSSFVLGFGRCGSILANKLRGLTADVAVAARNEEALAHAFALGYRPIKINELKKKIIEAEIIFNTIPALVLTADLLCLLAKDTVILDIASHPGGVDYPAAHRLGLKAELLPGIPGKIAPRSAGKILAKIYPLLILRSLKGKEC